MSLEDLDALIDMALLYAKRMLAPHGEFYPFGAAISLDGQRGYTAYQDPKRRLTSGQIREETLKVFRDQAQERKIRAAAFCMLARVVPKGGIDEKPAIYVGAENSDGDAVEAYLIYDWRGPDDVTWGDIVGRKGKPIIFAPNPGEPSI